MDILGKARRLESKIARRFDAAAADALGSEAREPLEIVHAIVALVEAQIQSSGRGKRIFPFNRIDVAVLAPSRDARVRIEAVFADEPSLRARIVERLRAAGCGVDDLTIETAYVARAAKSWENPHFHVAFDRETRAIAQAAPDPKSVRLELTVVRGTADQPAYTFAGERIEIGRCVEVRDSRNRLIRTNHVAFVEGSGEVNQSVSRRHAHIAYQADSGDYRLHDDGSAHGTGIVRGGRTIPVPVGARGVRLKSGDEIVLGEARLRITLDARQP
jgi:hypothetical protein